MIKKLVFLFLILLFSISFAFTPGPNENERSICHELIRTIAIHHTKPSKEELTKSLGYHKDNIAYTHHYHWPDLEVVFLNDEYIEHIGRFKFNPKQYSYEEITPKLVISFHGAPIKISKGMRNVMTWHCKYKASTISAILNHDDIAVKYYGRYCPETTAAHCIGYNFSKFDFKP